MQYDSRSKRLALCSFLGQFTIAMINFGIIYFLRDRLSFTSSEIGIASSIYTFSYFVFCLVFASAARNWGLRFKSVLSVAGMALSVLFILIFPTRAVSYAGLFLYGMFMAFYWPNIEVWMTQGKEGRELSSTVSLFNFSWSFGAGFSTFIGGLLAGMDVSYPLAAAIAFFIAISAILLFSGNSGKAEEEKAEAVEDHSTPLRFFAWIGVAVMYSGYSLLINIFPLYASAELGFSESTTGTLLFFRGMSACASFILLGRLSFWQFSRKTIILSQCAFAFLVLLSGAIRSAYLFIPYFIAFGFVFSLCYDLSIFHGAAGASNRSIRMTIHEVLLTVGTIIGSLLGGIVYEYFSFMAILRIISFTALAIAAAETASMLLIPGLDRR
ncbi:MAG: MFS transporter [Candidatus Ornithospirochaeta sp.]|nr:MFS transporter [Candidatus Ornithospirochaeta sp.]